MTIDLPAEPGVDVDASNLVHISGSPTATGFLNFNLEVSKGTDECMRPYWITLPSQPFDIVFVLDRSGSMKWKPASDTSVANSRWEALEAGVNSFTTVIDSACAGSNFGLSLFASRVLSSGDADPNYQLSDADFDNLVAIDGSLSGKVATELTFQSLPPKPWGATAMGSGVEEGIAMMADPTRPRVLMLFTDGQQNVNPRIHLLGTDYDDDNDGMGDRTIDPGGSELFKIVTVGIGTTPLSDYHTTLENLALEHGAGTYVATTTGGGIAVALETAISEVLDVCSPQMVASYNGTLTDQATLPAFAVNHKVGQLLVKVSVDRELSRSEFERFLSGLGQDPGVGIEKDGENIKHFFTPIIAGELTDFAFLRTDFTYTTPYGTDFLEPHGSYTIELNKPYEIEGDLGYRVVIYADDKRFDMDWRVEPAERRVKEPLHPTMTLTWLGRPVDEAKVKALVLTPGDDLGDLLARDPLTLGPDQLSTEEDAGSPGYQKYLQLLDGDLLSKLLPAEQQLDLQHQGGGVYSATFVPGDVPGEPGVTDVSGVYQIFYQVVAEDPDFGTVQRVAAQSVYVRFGEIDLEASEVQTVDVGDNTVTIDWRPITKGGRYIGPAQGGAFSFTGKGIRASRATDNQDGSYSLSVTADPGAQMSVKVLGEEIYQGEAGDFGPPTDPPDWWIWLIVLAVLLLIWLIWRGTRSQP